MTVRITRQALSPINARLEKASPLEILSFAHATFGDRVAMLCGMQRAGTALCHLADRAGLGFDVLFVDTGVMHQETLKTRDDLIQTHPRLRITTLSPARSFAAQTSEEGLLYLSRGGQERCCDMRKTEPLRAMRGRYDAFVSALRRGEGGARAKIQALDLDQEMGVLRIHPFVTQASTDLDQYIAAHPDVVVNPLHAMGFLTIGCFPCTTPVRDDEPERAGRWRHLAGVDYCGINPTDRANVDDAFVTLDDRYGPAFGMVGESGS
ncbi:MAG TPA: phosphoadenylyl-sulfate reductase [Polyangiaceae bacterium]|jgi:phosphoadenosine phosphosulfate reductase|nr:phosphoadenylyl-sulfate reductase [Polyangiaceae bacterium]